jgi:hypothetical protein
MQRRAKGSSPIVPPPRATDEGHDIAKIVDALLTVLRRHDAEPTEGVLALLTALVQSADRVMEASTPEETEHNRAALVAMLEHGRRYIDEWPQRTPDSWSVH